MDKDTINKMDSKVYSEMLEDALWQDETSALGINSGHCCIHYDKGEDDKEILSRIIKEEKLGISNFSDKNEALSLIQSAVVMDIENITNWIMKKKSEFTEEKDYKQYVTSVYMREKVGMGIVFDKNTGTYKQKESYAVRLVLEREYSELCPYGFYLKTSYPSMAKVNVRETGVEYTKDDIAKEEIYKFENNYEKAFYVCNKMNGCIISNKINENDYPYLKIHYTDESGSYKVFVQDDKTKICKKEHNDVLYKRCNNVPEKLREVIEKTQDIIGIKREISQDREKTMNRNQQYER